MLVSAMENEMLLKDAGLSYFRAMPVMVQVRLVSGGTPNPLTHYSYCTLPTRRNGQSTHWDFPMR